MGTEALLEKIFSDSGPCCGATMLLQPQPQSWNFHRTSDSHPYSGILWPSLTTVLGITTDRIDMLIMLRFRKAFLRRPKVCTAYIKATFARGKRHPVRACTAYAAIADFWIGLSAVPQILNLLSAFRFSLLKEQQLSRSS